MAAKPNPRAKRRRGQPGEPETRVTVIAIYAVTGNAADAARRAKVPERTAQRYISRALSGEDAEGAAVLAEVGADLRARALDAAGRALVSSIQECESRVRDRRWVRQFKSDPTPQYVRAIADAYRTIASEGKDAPAPVAVVVNTGADVEAITPQDARRRMGQLFGSVTPDDGAAVDVSN